MARDSGIGVGFWEVVGRESNRGLGAWRPMAGNPGIDAGARVQNTDWERWGSNGGTRAWGPAAGNPDCILESRVLGRREQQILRSRGNSWGLCAQGLNKLLWHMETYLRVLNIGPLTGEFLAFRQSSTLSWDYKGGDDHFHNGFRLGWHSSFVLHVNKVRTGSAAMLVVVFRVIIVFILIVVFTGRITAVFRYSLGLTWRLWEGSEFRLSLTFLREGVRVLQLVLTFADAVVACVMRQGSGGPRGLSVDNSRASNWVLSFSMPSVCFTSLLIYFFKVPV